jgi:peptide/nickel transport system substrate-binding protein
MGKLWLGVAKALLLAFCAFILPFDTALAETTIHIGLTASDTPSLDPHVSTATSETVIFAHIFSGLVRFRPGRMSAALMEPDLAESWDASADGTVWTFRLRRGVQFHHGYGELTADDVVYSLQRASDPKRSSVSSDYDSFDRIEAVDRYTVRITLKAPVPSLLGLVANYHGGNIISKKAADELGDGFKQHPIGTGPYMFDAYQPKQSITLIANKGYFRGAPKIDRLDFKFIPSDASRELAYEKGELDVFSGVREERWVKRMQQNPNNLVDVFDPGELRTLHFNTAIKPLDDIRVRRAIAYAIDREDFIKLAGESVTRLDWSPVPDGYIGGTDEVPHFEYDPEKAKALLKEAGYGNGLKLSVIITKLSALLKPMEVVQEQLRKVGIQLDLNVVEHAVFHAQIRKDLSALVLYGAARFPVADSYLTPFYHSQSSIGRPTAVTNFSHCNAADAEIEAARHETNLQKQLAIWETAQRKIIESVCAVPLFEQLQVWVRRKSIDYGYTLIGSLSLGPVFTEASTVQ